MLDPRNAGDHHGAAHADHLGEGRPESQSLEDVVLVGKPAGEGHVDDPLAPSASSEAYS